MKDWKTIAKRLLFPPPWLAVLLALASGAALAFVFLHGLDTSPAAYAVYVLSFYALTVVCAYCAAVLPGICRRVRRRVYGNKYAGRYLTDVGFKTHVSLFRSLAINLLYVAVNLLSGILYRTAWFAVLAAYYTILAVMRFLLLRYVNRNPIGESPLAELRRSRLCAVILTTVNLTLSGVVLMMMYQRRGFVYHGIFIYVMALYTFYTAAYAAASSIKYRRYKSPVMSMAKMISLASALVSILPLEAAMLAQFGTGGEGEDFDRIMIAATGAGVSVAVVAMSVYMIVKCSLDIRKLRAGKDKGRR